MRLTGEKKRKKRHLRVRKKISGTYEKPRLVVFRSNLHIYASLVVDEEKPNKVLTVISSLTPGFKKLSGEGKMKGGNVSGAETVGALIAKKAKELKIEKVVFDRGGYKYTGRVKALADSARKGGLKF